MHLHKIKEGVSKSIMKRNDKAMKQRLTGNNVPVDAVQSRIMSPTFVVDSMSNWRRTGSFSLPPLQGTTSHELSVPCYQIEEDIINGNVDTNRMKLSHKSNGERRIRNPWIAPHQQLNAKFQCLKKDVR
jgi:hypothetical protein